ncbi:hypothetical protein [Methylobacillus sp.]|uniref:hypothetical protein n=1 Tax=Methylobacillus sp. TaxID=56818 RepID=UPI002FE04394
MQYTTAGAVATSFILLALQGCGEHHDLADALSEKDGKTYLSTSIEELSQTRIKFGVSALGQSQGQVEIKHGRMTYRTLIHSVQKRGKISAYTDLESECIGFESTAKEQFYLICRALKPFAADYQVPSESRTHHISVDENRLFFIIGQGKIDAPSSQAYYDVNE